MSAPLGPIRLLQTLGHVLALLLISCTSLVSSLLIRAPSLTSFLSTLHDDVQVHFVYLALPIYYFVFPFPSAFKWWGIENWSLEDAPRLPGQVFLCNDLAYF